MRLFTAGSSSAPPPREELYVEHEQLKSSAEPKLPLYHVLVAPQRRKIRNQMDTPPCKVGRNCLFFLIKFR